MIGKIVKGASFSRVLAYLHDKEGAELIGGNMAGQNPAQLVKEFSQSRGLNPELKKSVCHISLSVAVHEPQAKERWQAIASDYVEEMGFGNCQYVVYQHHDQDHDHIHIVASRTQLSDGKTVNDSWDFRRTENLLRELETSYNLQSVQPSWEKGERSPTTGQSRYTERTGNPGVRPKLQQILNEAIAADLAMPQFIEAIQRQGVSVRLSQKSAGVTGISYALDGLAFSGTQLGRDFTFPGLQKRRQLSYLAERDDEAIAYLLQHPTQPITATKPEPDLEPGQASPQPPGLPPEIDPLQRQAAEAIAPIAVALFDASRRGGTLLQPDPDVEAWTLNGTHYSITYDKTAASFSISATDGRGELIRLHHHLQDDSGLEIAHNIQREDLERFQKIHAFLLEQQRQNGQIEIDN